MVVHTKYVEKGMLFLKYSECKFMRITINFTYIYNYRMKLHTQLNRKYFPLNEFN